MKEYFEIVDVLARKSETRCGGEAVEVEITLDDGTVGRASVYSNDPMSVENVNTEISEALVGLNVLDHTYIDSLMLEIDEEEGKRLGTGAVLATSIACAKAAADATGLSLYNYIGGINAKCIPTILEEDTEYDKIIYTDYPTLSDLIDVCNEVRKNGSVLSMSSGFDDTEDNALADIAVAVNADFIETGSFFIKNELSRIAEELFS